MRYIIFYDLFEFICWFSVNEEIVNTKENKIQKFGNFYSSLISLRTETKQTPHAVIEIRSNASFVS